MDKQALDRIVSVTNGVGDISSVEYADATAGGIVKLSGARLTTYPDHAVSTTGKLVSRLIKGNGIASNRSQTYQYWDPAVNVKGRGSLGFGSVVETDEQTGIVTTSTYNQVWPFTGTLRTSSQVVGGVTISDTVNTPASKAIVQANNSSTTFVYDSSSKTCRRDLGNGIDLGCSTTTNTYGDNFGNLTNQQVVQQLADGSGTKFTTETATAFQACATNWMPGLPQSVALTKSDSGASVTRTQTFEYDCVTGLLLSDTVEPGTQQYQVKTTYGRANPFGVVNTKTQAWYAPQSGGNVTRVAFDVAYDGNGRYPVTVNTWTDATHQYGETVTYDAATGARRASRDANGLTTSWEVDGFGKVTKTLRPDGNETRDYAKLCRGDCPLGATVARISDNFHDASRITVPAVTYFDSVGHQLRVLTWGFDGRAINVDQRYDAMGRLFESDWPRFDNASAYLSSRQYYDVLNRPTTTVTRDEFGTEQSTSVAYQGLTTVHTNAKRQKRTDKRNVAGELVEVIDDNNLSTVFGYELSLIHI